MIKKSVLQKIVRDYQTQQQAVGRLKREAEEIRTKSKAAIAALRHRNDQKAKQLINEVEVSLKAGQKLTRQHRPLGQIGFYKDALEEYVEAKALQAYLTKSELNFPSTIDIDLEAKIGGLADLTGELVRRAITIGSRESYKEIEKFKHFVEEIVEIFANLSFSGKLRQKHDDMERNLKRLEKILYELRLRS